MNPRLIVVVAIAPLAFLAACAHDRADYSQFSVAEPRVEPITRYADANNDGKVTREEAKADPNLARSFDQYDGNKDGVLDRGEFARLEADSVDHRAPGLETPDAEPNKEEPSWYGDRDPLD